MKMLPEGPIETTVLYGPCKLAGGCMHAPHASAEKEKEEDIVQVGHQVGWDAGVITQYTCTEKLADLLGKKMVFEIDRIDNFALCFEAMERAISVYEHYRYTKTYSEEDLHFFRMALAAQIQKIRTLARCFEPGLLSSFDLKIQSLSADFSAFFSSFIASAFRFATQG